MVILFDLFTPQCQIGGAGEYIRRVFYTLCDTIHKSEAYRNVKVYALIDSSYGKYAYSDLTPDALLIQGVECVDISKSSLKEILEEYHVDKVFIGCAQYWGAKYDIASLNIPVVCIVHDLCEEEYQSNNINDYVKIGKFCEYLRWKFYIFRKGNKGLKRLPPIINQAKKNTKFEIVCVSDYSKNSLIYNFNFPTERIYVLYSPLRINTSKQEIDNKTLCDLIKDNKKYYLFLNANRIFKNPHKAFNAFEKYVECGHHDMYIVTTGCKEKKFKNHIPLGYLSDNDLDQLMRHCYALLFPTFMEGFGYPPIEAMRYGKPVICSNVTSVPEICGDAAIYFSPLYESDIFRALSVLTSSNYDEYVAKSKARYHQVSERQKTDLNELIKMILRK